MIFIYGQQATPTVGRDDKHPELSYRPSSPSSGAPLLLFLLPLLLLLLLLCILSECIFVLAPCVIGGVTQQTFEHEPVSVSGRAPGQSREKGKNKSFAVAHTMHYYLFF